MKAKAEQKKYGVMGIMWNNLCLWSQAKDIMIFMIFTDYFCKYW